MDDPTEPASPMPEFDLDRANAEAWSAFADRLAEVLSVMDADGRLTLTALAPDADDRPPFVAFTALAGGALRAVAAGDAQVGPEYALAPEAVQQLTDRGWTPTEAGFERSGDQEHAPDLAEAAVAVLRDTYGVPHPAFLAPDELAEILTPTAVLEETPAGLPAPSGAAAPASLEALDAQVAAVLAEEFGHVPAKDAQGDYGVRVGSTMIFVRPTPDAGEVLVFAAVVHDIEGRSRAMETLSDLNTEARFVKFILVRDRVFASMSVQAQPFVGEHLRQAVRIVSMTGDGVDDELAAKLRGRTTFPEDGGSAG